MYTFTVPKLLTSAHWIHDDTKFVDLDFKIYNKKQMLNRIEAWKNWLTQRKIKKLMLFDYTNLNSVSIFFACFELGIQIRTSTEPAKIDSNEVDLVILGPTYKNFNDSTNLKFVLIDYKTLADSTVEYQPTAMDPDFICLTGTLSFISGLYTQDIKTLYWATAASEHSFKFYGKKYCSYPQFNHVGTIALSVTGPIFGGAKIYAIDHFHEMIMLASRGVVDVVFMFGSQLSAFIEFEKNQNLIKKNYKVDLNNVEINTGGTSVSPAEGDWVLNRGGKRILTVFTDNNVMAPIFIENIDSTNFDFLKRTLGKSCSFVKSRIDENNCLWVKNEINSSILQPTVDGWFKTSDFVMEKNGQYLFKGRKRIGNNFLTDYEDIVVAEVNDGTVNFGDFLLTYSNDSNTITINAFNLSLYDKLSGIQHTLISKMKKLGNISDLYIDYLDPSKGQKGTHG